MTESTHAVTPVVIVRPTMTIFYEGQAHVVKTNERIGDGPRYRITAEDGAVIELGASFLMPYELADKD